jgi:hypothetical protein
MLARYPRLEQYSPGGHQVLRDGLVVAFFIRRPHREIAESVLRALELYRRSVGPEKLGWYTSSEGWLEPLDTESWEDLQTQMRQADGRVLDLWEHSEKLGGYRFEYRGRKPATVSAPHGHDAVSGVSFWLPTEYLEEHGPVRVTNLAAALARELPLSTGYASLAFNALMDMRGVNEMLHELAFRYPGMDMLDIELTMRIGARPKGAYWLNFYGQPLLGELGGAAGLRERLSLPEFSLHELEGDKVLVALGEWPEVEGEMRPYRELARVLEPHLYHETLRWPGFPPEEMRRWERRFLG